MDVRCSLWGFRASIMTLLHHSDSVKHSISQNPPSPSEAYQCKGALTYPSTAYQCAKTYCIYIIWMWDAIYGVLKPWPWLYKIIQTQPFPQFAPNPSPPSEGYQCKGALTYPSTAYQDAETLYIYIIWMWDAVYRALKPRLWLYNITWTQPFPQFSPNPPQPYEVYQCKGALTCSSTTYQDAKTYCIYNMDVWHSLWGFGGPTNRQNNN